jgi:hypothetical protein
VRASDSTRTPTDTFLVVYGWRAAGSADDVEELLVRHGVEVNAADHLGNTALHYAAGAGHLAAVLALLARPSLRLNATNNVGDTPLHKAPPPPSPLFSICWLAGWLLSGGCEPTFIYKIFICMTYLLARRVS